MDQQANYGWILVVAGLVLAGIGLLWVLSPSLPWLGRLPGDINFEGRGFRFSFPIVTSLLLSLVLTLALGLVRLLRRQG